VQHRRSHEAGEELEPDRADEHQHEPERLNLTVNLRLTPRSTAITSASRISTAYGRDTSNTFGGWISLLVNDIKRALSNNRRMAGWHPKILPIPDVHAAFALPGNVPTESMLCGVRGIE
jgi:hypothetical protein